jgi:hypothetical protein
MRKGLSGKALLILGLTGALGVGALAIYVKEEPGAAKVMPSLLGDQTAPKPIRSVTTADTEGTDTPSKPNKAEKTVYMPKIDGVEATLRSEKATVPAGKDPMQFVAAACLKEANVDGVKVRSVRLEDGLAVIDFDKTILDGMGAEQEGSFLKALQVSFGQFKNVRRVELDAENEEINSLGSIEISGPLRVVRPGESADESA